MWPHPDGRPHRAMLWATLMIARWRAPHCDAVKRCATPTRSRKPPCTGPVGVMMDRVDDAGFGPTQRRTTLPGGATFALTTAAASGELWVADTVAAGEDANQFLRGMDWSDIACAAVVVPAAHPTATDRALRDELLARAEAAAR